MNIFYLDSDPTICAKMHNDKHCVKMILESAQMLSTAHRQLDGDDYADTHKLYKNAMVNHPSTIWVRSSHMHYRYLYDLFVALCDEYTDRYGKQHASDRQLRVPLAKAPDNIPQVTWNPPPQCMPEEYKMTSSILAYRKYYINDKGSFSTWKNRPTPYWFRETA